MLQKSSWDNILQQELTKKVYIKSNTKGCVLMALVSMCVTITLTLNKVINSFGNIIWLLSSMLNLFQKY